MLAYIKNKVQIKTSFFICILIIIALGLTEQFFIIFFAVSVHELFHIILAKKNGLKTEKIIITPIGQSAVIDDIGRASALQKICILLAGPAVNFFMAFVTVLIVRKLSFFVTVNLVIGTFNLLPVYPLDGGRILHAVLENKLGEMSANKIILRVSAMFANIFIALGFIQVIIYPFNISLLLIGVYIRKMLKEEKINLTLNYYLKMVQKYGE